MPATDRKLLREAYKLGENSVEHRPIMVSTREKFLRGLEYANSPLEIRLHRDRGSRDVYGH